jgi:hypothetical protein
MRLISSSFLPMAIAVTADGLGAFREADVLECAELFRLDFINKGYRLNVYILYLCDFFKNFAFPFLTIFVKGSDQVVGNHLCRTAFNMMTFNHMNQLTIFE